MAEIINLRSARKAKARAAKKQRGDENAAQFGRSKSERAEDAATRQQAVRRHDGHKIEDEE